jgi:hypothetical protein
MATTSIVFPVGPGRTKKLGFEGRKNMSVTPFKGDRFHGEIVSYDRVRSLKNGDVYDKSCYKEGEKVALDPCVVD